MRSPSFSLPSSSMTTRNSPRAKASRASSIGSKRSPSARPLVDFTIDDRGPDMISRGLNCLKSATGAIVEFTWAAGGKMGRGGGGGVRMAGV